MAQTEQALAKLGYTFPSLEFEVRTFESAGDLDQKTSLLADGVGDDFFTDQLDRALLSGEIDAAFHSAKDLPDYEGSDIDWFFLPWREDPRDTLIWPKGRERNTTNPTIGISSPSREAFAKARWPDAKLAPIRGPIDDRIAQLDRGDFDVIILAIAGLNRLGLEGRIDEALSLEALPTHPDQGALAMTFRKDHEGLRHLRRLMMPPIVVAGAGTGRDGHYSVATREALEACDVCLHDALLDAEILGHAQGELQHVGKRYDDPRPGERQAQIIALLKNQARRMKKVVRLKGGDPSVFGRLSEELEALIELDIPFRVLPGIPWLCSAPLRHGIYLTERQSIRHFQVATGTEIEGKTFDGRDLDPEKGPVYFFMAMRKIPTIVEGLIKRGYEPNTPCAVFREEHGAIRRATLATVEWILEDQPLKPPALLLVGDAADPTRAFTPPRRSLDGCRVLIPGTPSTREALAPRLRDLGAEVLPLEVFKLEANHGADWVETIPDYDWVVLSSASAVDVLFELMDAANIDLRRLPHLAVSGPSAAKALKARGLHTDYMPTTYTSRELGEGMLVNLSLKDQKVLIPRSTASRSPLPTILEDAGARVDVRDLYENRSLEVPQLPSFDAICFCSPSALTALLPHREQLLSSTIASIGPVTRKALEEEKLPVHVEPRQYDAEHLVFALADHWTWRRGE